MRSAKYYVDFIEGNSYINNIFAAEKNLRRLPRLLTYLKGMVNFVGETCTPRSNCYKD